MTCGWETDHNTIASTNAPWVLFGGGGRTAARCLAGICLDCASHWDVHSQCKCGTARRHTARQTANPALVAAPMRIFVYCASLVVNSRLDENRKIAEILLLGRRGESGGSPRLRDAQTLERCASPSSTNVRHDDQFENDDIRELNVIFLDLACGVGWAEIPLLAHNFSK